MRIFEKDGNIIIEQAVDFDIEQILECGQCFHFEKLEDKEYVIVAFAKLLHIKQIGNSVIFYNTSMNEYDNIWKKYFDMDIDYGVIKQALLSKDDKLKNSVDAMGGIRLLNQEFFEMLLSFIISQNKQIPHIKKLVFHISERFGEYIGEINGKKYYAFPTPVALSRVTVEEWQELKTGFRAPYLYDAVKKVNEGVVDENKLLQLDNDALINSLKEIKGVGDKVANCIMLFSLGKRDAFPIDVWIKRIMEEMYFGKETKKEIIAAYAKELYGEYGGYAQQYLFHYGRNSKNEKK